ncbi:uncharacterized protein apof [Salarias fasciatus]|uniref:Apolipoprotein F n=1 Tax=Salarias fasciatus TaxID=181472 RepID=A0A672JN04_SALFA|nr:apolipoprotein F [Salarias fasciatus]
MMSSRLKWLIVIQLLLNEGVLCQVPPPPVPGEPLPPGAQVSQEDEEMAQLDHSSIPASQFQPRLSPEEKSTQQSVLAQNDERVVSAQVITSVLWANLQGKIQDRLQIHGNISCEELLSASTVDDPLSSAFPQELLGLSLVPVLVAMGCPKEAQTLTMKLYDLLGVADTNELLMQVEALIEGRMSNSNTEPPSTASFSEKDQARQHMEAVMYNIQQLAGMDDSTSKQDDPHCEGWSRMNGTILIGRAVEGGTGGLEDAVSSCERLGVLCAGVTSTGALTPGLYEAVLKKGSRILPSVATESECWIRQCSDDAWTAATSGGRMKRSAQQSCINQSEQRVYNVVEWIPAVSTLYNLGTAVYYASVNCSETAKERAILSAVDLGTDALMVATGGTAGVAGYALGAGVKTGVKAGVRYLLNSMKEEDDVMVNQTSWEQGILTIQ